MAQIKNITDDSDLISYYYIYKRGFLNKNDSQIPDTDKMKIGCKNFLKAILRCLTQIKDESNSEQSRIDEDTKRIYLDWIRWNNLLFIEELNRFERIPDLEDCRSDIKAVRDDIQAIMKRYFQLSDTEKAIANKYVHAIDRVKRDQLKKNEVKVKAYQHAGALLINYVDILQAKCYVHSLDRIGITFEDLKSQSELLAEALLQTGSKEKASDIRRAIKAYGEFRERDEEALKKHEKLMMSAITLVHSKATKYFIEKQIRDSKEIITKIRQKMMDSIYVLINPILEPENIPQSLFYIANNPDPIKTFKEICKFAIENPFEIVLLVGKVYLLSKLEIINNRDIPLIASRLLTVEVTKKKIELIKSARETMISNNEKQGQQVVNEIKSDREKRILLRKAQEKDLSNLHRENTQERNRQLNELNDTQARLENTLAETQEQLQQQNEQYIQNQRDYMWAHNRREKSSKQIHDIAQKSQLSRN